MSSSALFSQAGHTLTLIGQKGPSQEHLKQLHNGFLSDLVDAIMAGTMPNRETFRTSIGLPSLQSVPALELEIDPIIRVDYSIRPSYSDWMKEVMHPKLENVGPAEYNISTVKQWLHLGQQNGKSIEGNKIYDHLKKTDTLKICLGLRDLEEIQKKGIAFFRKYFKGKAVFGWRSIVRVRNGSLFIPYLYERGGKVLLGWDWAGNYWRGSHPALRHLSISENFRVPTPTPWTVDDEGNIHFTLTSNGFTREQWEQHLECRGWRIGDYARPVLRRASEAPTNGVTYNIVVRPGKKISDSDRITKKIRAAADKKGWVKPHWEVACLIRDTFTDEQLEQMGLWYIVTMHEPIRDSVGGPVLLDSDRGGGGRWLGARYDRPDVYWSDGGGFAFVEQQVDFQI